MSPAITSTIPTICIKVLGFKGITFVARGLRYISQLTILLKYLSSPAMIGPAPKPIRSAHQAKLSRASNRFIRVSCAMESRNRSWLQESALKEEPEILWHSRPRLWRCTEDTGEAAIALKGGPFH